MSAAQESGWASTASDSPLGGEGGGDFPPGEGVGGGWARPPREAYHTIGRGEKHTASNLKTPKKF